MQRKSDEARSKGKRSIRILSVNTLCPFPFSSSFLTVGPGGVTASLIYPTPTDSFRSLLLLFTSAAALYSSFLGPSQQALRHKPFVDAL